MPSPASKRRAQARRAAARNEAGKPATGIDRSVRLAELRQRFAAACQVLVDLDLTKYLAGSLYGMYHRGFDQFAADEPLTTVEQVVELAESHVQNPGHARAIGQAWLSRNAKGNPARVARINAWAREAKELLPGLMVSSDDASIRPLRLPPITIESGASRIRELLVAIDRANELARRQRVQK